jgi:archaellum component FlaG (FlaF/FlaG flagellin family)
LACIAAYNSIIASYSGESASMSISRAERTDDLTTAIQAAQQGAQAEIWTALPGQIISFDPGKMTCKVQPTVTAKVTDSEGVAANTKLPVLVDVPVIFPSAGGFSLTFPVQAGDECLVMFASRCIDAWWQLGGVRDQVEPRMHDLSDGFAIVGPKSLPNVVQNLSATDVQLRSNAGNTRISLNNDDVTVEAARDVVVNAQRNVTIQTAQDCQITATNVTITGNLTLSGAFDHTGAIANFANGLKVTGDVQINSLFFNTHVHAETGVVTLGPA